MYVYHEDSTSIKAKHWLYMLQMQDIINSSDYDRFDKWDHEISSVY